MLVCQQEGTIHTHLAEPGRQRDNNTSLRSLNLQQRGQIVVARNILGVGDKKARLENDLTTDLTTTTAQGNDLTTDLTTTTAQGNDLNTARGNLLNTFYCPLTDCPAHF